MNTNPDESLSLARPHPSGVRPLQKVALALGSVALLCLLLSTGSYPGLQVVLIALATLAGLTAGALWYDRGVVGWMTGIFISGFYICLYWYPEPLSGLISMLDPLSIFLRGRPADQWFLYGFSYTALVLAMGIRFMYKYRGNAYQQWRTVSVMFFQLVFSFLIPAWMMMMNQPEFYFSYFWPLKYEYLFPDTVGWFTGNYARTGVFLVFWGAVMSFIAVPLLTWYFGKRWYCSWVCGCGALAETVGDPYRSLSDKSLGAWKVERWMIHSVLLIIVLLTLLLWINSREQGTILGSYSLIFSKTYSFLIGSMFSGVIGTGFYPIFGSRVWCRFGCPQAAIMGIIQRRWSRFRITTNGGQCISCGNCSEYCEMGIDVKSYAQRGEDIVRASCVGCGICSAVCPRGVLKLENGTVSL
ncbi:MAG: 4Fe-4S binding protein [Bacteroidota bacterium]|jgi:ferredoxin-type protein NapH